MKNILFVAVLALPVLARGAALLPSVEGTTWRYDLIDDAAGSGTPGKSEITVRLVGTQTFEEKTLLRLETRTSDALTNVELLAVDENQIVCHARGGKDGKLMKLDPPEIVAPANRAIGSAWELDGEVAGMKTHERFTVAAEESVVVAAGKFAALRFHCTGTGLLSYAIDRWFVAGTGFVKETTTVRGPSGGLVQRITRELKNAPEITAPPATPTPTPAATPTPAPEAAVPPGQSGDAADEKPISVEISSDSIAGSQTEFHSDVPRLYVRWNGHNLPANARVRVTWIAEDVGDIVEPNFIVDETETVATAPDFGARFTLARPEDGWAEGKYRLEVYLNDELAETLRVRISK